ncbi:MAG: hypothetical protein CM1200mP2_03360 [Planctomycetaceae bacterium]|nr:MAG: hypothetical protein CM1200mP2_03360 [Planctomycetaceae bacterium]
MVDTIREHLAGEIAGIREQGLYKSERVLGSPQRARIEVSDGEVLNFCANNYLGLSDHPDVVAAAREALDRWGFGLSRYASSGHPAGPQATRGAFERVPAHRRHDPLLVLLRRQGGLFETLLDSEDAVISDSLNHARSLTVCGCVRRGDLSTPTMTWMTWNRSCRRRPVRGID